SASGGGYHLRANAVVNPYAHRRMRSSCCGTLLSGSTRWFYFVSSVYDSIPTSVSLRLHIHSVHIYEQ
ncbi:hypothetical protein CEP51_004627, partial [Fusarium floridanum]